MAYPDLPLFNGHSQREKNASICWFDTCLLCTNTSYFYRQIKQEGWESLKRREAAIKNKAINISSSITEMMTDAEGRKDLKAFSIFQSLTIHSASTRNSIVNYCF